jgi:hypothetical protein
MALGHNLNAVEFDGVILGQRTQITRANDDGQHGLYLNGEFYAWLPPDYDQEQVEDLILDYWRARNGE